MDVAEEEIEVVDNEGACNQGNSSEVQVDLSKSWVWAHFEDKSTKDKNGEIFIAKKCRYCSAK